MKHTKTLLVAALAALAIGSAQAETIYVTGSTAFRSSANLAINSLTGVTRIASDATSYTGASNLLWKIVNGGTTNYISAHWSGDQAGIQSLTRGADGSGQAASLPFLDPSQTFTTVDSTNNAAQATNQHASGIAFSNVYQSSSVFNGNKAGDGYNYPPVAADKLVGVVSFVYVASKNFPGSNITTTAVKNLLGNGYSSVALFTGSGANTNDVAFLLGRNKDAGNRLIALAETGYGVSKPVQQYAVGTGHTYSTNVNGVVTNITANITGAAGTNSIISYPVETINGIGSSQAGNSGYSSAGTLVGFMTNVYAPQTSMQVDGGLFDPLGLGQNDYTGNTYLIGYAGQSDANGKTNGGLIVLTYNGVAPSTNTIIQGQYPFWSYEHLLLSPHASAATSSLYTTLVSAVLATPTSTLSPNVNLNDLTTYVSRAGDGGVISQNY